MSKGYKIKRYKKYGAGSGSYHAKPHPVAVVLCVAAVAVLIFVGISIYGPVYSFITSDRSAGEISLPDPEPQPDGEESPTSQADEKPQPGLNPGAVRAAYLPAATALDEAALASFLDQLKNTETNAVMVDIKDENGLVLYNTKNEKSAEWGAVSSTPTDLSTLSEELESRGLSLVVRMQTFRDPIAASASRDNAIRYRDTEWLWLDAAADAGGKPWLNPYSVSARQYLTDLALEAADAGAVLIVLDTFQFPAGSSANATFGDGSTGISRAQALSGYLEDLSGALREKGARTAIYVTATALTQDSEHEVRYGGSPMALGAEAVVVGALPYQFGGDYSFGGLTVESPVQNPGGVTETVLAYISATYLSGADASPAIIPLVQGGNEPSANAAAPYTKEQVDAQLTAVRTAGLEEYILYSTTGDYLLQQAS